MEKGFVGKVIFGLNFFFFFFFLSLCLFRGHTPWHMEVPRLGGLIGAIAAGLRQSHSNVGPEPCLRPTP